jgi:hypothetical protein
MAIISSMIPNRLSFVARSLSRCAFLPGRRKGHEASRRNVGSDGAAAIGKPCREAAITAVAVKKGCKAFRPSLRRRKSLRFFWILPV